VHDFTKRICVLQVMKILPPGSLKSPLVTGRIAPSLDDFLCEYLLPGLPVTISGGMDHWPAMTKWHDFAYLQSVAGRRTVPVEVRHLPISSFFF
jgi:hypothetical protein